MCISESPIVLVDCIQIENVMCCMELTTVLFIHCGLDIFYLFAHEVDIICCELNIKVFFTRLLP